MIKLITLAIMFFAVFFASISFNIIFHETAHYVVADAYNLDPEMHFAPEGMSASGLYSMDSSIAYVQYSSDTTSITAEDAIIASAGPFANLFLACMGLFFYFNPKRSQVTKILLILIIVPSFVSFAINILPVFPGDGYYILQYLF